MTLSNWRVRYFLDKAYGKSIDINEAIGIDKRSMSPIAGSIYDPALGNIIASDANEDIRAYTCFCGKLNSRLYEGDLCDECDTICKEQFSISLENYGWLDTKQYYVIQPAAFELIQTVIGAKTFDSIINYQVNIGIEGTALSRETLLEKKKKIGPFENIGLVEFKRRFIEIMNYYGRIKPNKLAKAQFLIANKQRVFTNKIPIYSSLLRPAYASSSKKMFSYDKINAYYTSMINNIKLLLSGSSKRLKVSGPLVVMYAIQVALQQSYHATAGTKLIGKPKIIRQTILSTKTCFSSRAVITSLTGKYAGLDHIVVNYKQFLELYTLEILNCMMRGIGNPAFASMTLYELLEYLRRVKFSSECNESIYFIMEYLITNHKQGLWCILNRNPTMDLGSIQTMRIVHVIKDPKVTVMKIPITSLAAMTADYDGDVLNLYSIKELQLLKPFITGFSPRFLCTDRTGDNMINNDFLIEKDQICSLCDFVQPL